MLRVSVKKKSIKIQIKHPQLGSDIVVIGPLFRKIEKSKVTVNRKGHLLVITVAKMEDGKWHRLLKNKKEGGKQRGSDNFRNFEENKRVVERNNEGSNDEYAISEEKNTHEVGKNDDLKGERQESHYKLYSKNQKGSHYSHYSQNSQEDYSEPTHFHPRTPIKNSIPPHPNNRHNFSENERNSHAPIPISTIITPKRSEIHSKFASQLIRGSVRSKILTPKRKMPFGRSKSSNKRGHFDNLTHLGHKERLKIPGKYKSAYKSHILQSKSNQKRINHLQNPNNSGNHYKVNKYSKSASENPNRSRNGTPQPRDQHSDHFITP